MRKGCFSFPFFFPLSIFFFFPSDGRWAGAEPGKSAGTGSVALSGRRSRHAFAEDNRGQTAPLERPAKATEGRGREPAGACGRTLLGPYRSVPRSPVHGGGMAAVVLPPVAAAPPAPGQTRGRFPPYATGRKSTSNDFTRLHSQGWDRRSTASQEGLRTTARTRATRHTRQRCILPREFAPEFPAESEDLVFHPQRPAADPWSKGCLTSPLGRLVVASVAAPVTRRLPPGSPAAAARSAGPKRPPPSPRWLVPYLTSPPPSAPQGSPPKREELAPGLERSLGLTRGVSVR